MTCLCSFQELVGCLKYKCQGTKVARVSSPRHRPSLQPRAHGTLCMGVVCKAPPASSLPHATQRGVPKSLACVALELGQCAHMQTCTHVSNMHSHIKHAHTIGGR